MTLRVYLHRVPIGRLASNEGRWGFRFDDEYLDLEDRPVLGRWFEDQRMSDLRCFGEPGGLPYFFQNYLPEPESAMRRLLAEEHGIDPRNEGRLLAALADDLPGAIEARPEGAVLVDEEPVARPVAPDLKLRFSLAGMMLKLSAVERDRRLVIPATGKGTRWIAKFPDRPKPGEPRLEGLTVHEHAVMSLAQRVAIKVPRVALYDLEEVAELPVGLDFAERSVLAVERFDRDSDGRRTHQEDFAQVLNRRPDDKYNQYVTSPLAANWQSLGRTIHTVCGADDFSEYLRRLVFSVLIGNSDAHLKNWALYYPDRRNPRLAPAYDLNSTIAYESLDADMALKLFKKKAFADVHPVDLLHMATKAGADRTLSADVIRETVERFREAWPEVAGDLPPLGARERIERHLAALPLYTLPVRP